MAERPQNETEIVLAPNEYVYVQDRMKGHVSTYVGPYKATMSTSDEPVSFDIRSKRFIPCTLEKATQVFSTAPEGWYIIMKNPAENGGHPAPKTSNDSADLIIGKKVNIAGPVSFALYPGQMVKIIQGHRLRFNQYVIARVYDNAEAEKSLEFLKDLDDSLEDSLEIGRQIIVKGTDVNFFIPPSGVEVIPQADGSYIRDAVTLEDLEYCILKDEDGNRRYVYGPDVVFPNPTETFVTGTHSDNPKSRALELSETSGIYVKVVVEHDEYPNLTYPEQLALQRDDQFPPELPKIEESAEPSQGEVLEPPADGAQEGTSESSDSPAPAKLRSRRSGTKKRKKKDLTELGQTIRRRVGDELFITGKDQMIYYPRPEHTIIKYDDQIIHYAVAIPEGEARYCLNKESGEVRTVVGPDMFLPDPRKEVVVRRVLTSRQCSLYYPGNDEALAHNSNLRSMISQTGGVDFNDAVAYSTPFTNSVASGLMSRSSSEEIFKTSADLAQDSKFSRKTKFTAPRTITLDTKYDGAVSIDIWTGYAIKVISKSGDRKVIVGPCTYLLNYDETLEVMELSTGKPKTTDNLFSTVYLRVMNNKISDVIRVESKDYCSVDVKVSYCVDFVGDPNNWFDIENYVKFLCDHLRSILKSKVKQLNIAEFYNNYVDIIRDNVLMPDKSARKFEQNGMEISDVEVLSIHILDSEVSGHLEDLQRATREAVLDKSRLAIQNDLVRAKTEAQLERDRLSATVSSNAQKLELLKVKERAETEAIESELKRKLNLYERETEVFIAQAQSELEKQTVTASIEIDRERTAARLESDELISKSWDEKERLEIERKELNLALELRELEARTAATSQLASQITPDLIAALHEAARNPEQVAEIAKAMSPLAIVNGESIGDSVQKLLRGTAYEGIAREIFSRVINQDSDRD